MDTIIISLWRDDRCSPSCVSASFSPPLTSLLSSPRLFRPSFPPVLSSTSFVLDPPSSSSNHTLSSSLHFPRR
ncbi:hypothetical protein MAP00_000135 [Monascus purpureus]|nr:hypothetical protein MAP00_000135 [Monascus purpureus]